MPKVSEEHKEQRKHQILMAAMEVFKRKGYEKATVKDIVEETRNEWRMDLFCISQIKLKYLDTITS